MMSFIDASFSEMKRFVNLKNGRVTKDKKKQEISNPRLF
jgi:hypothetical protein